ncbi:hypothetical protein OC846_005541, partial [Tilletia horrida]
MRGAGAKSYTNAELDILLDHVEKIRPIGGNHWDKVTAAYLTECHKVGGLPHRDMDSLRRKYTALVNAKKPT